MLKPYGQLASPVGDAPLLEMACFGQGNIKALLDWIKALKCKLKHYWITGDGTYARSRLCLKSHSSSSTAKRQWEKMERKSREHNFPELKHKTVIYYKVRNLYLGVRNLSGKIL